MASGVMKNSALTEITLSYTFFRLNKPGSEQTAAASRADEGTSSPAIN
jgi:cytochrome c oxidase assembly protein Cox11